jgi:hypothetical protein
MDAIAACTLMNRRPEMGEDGGEGSILHVFGRRRWAWPEAGSGNSECGGAVAVGRVSPGLHTFLAMQVGSACTHAWASRETLLCSIKVVPTKKSYR